MGENTEINEFWKDLQIQILISMTKKMKKYYSHQAPFVSTVIPRRFGLKIMSNLKEYTPIRRKHGFQIYRLCSRLDFISFFGDTVTKEISIREGQVLKLAINFEEEPPRLIYNQENSTLIIAFSYRPLPFDDPYLPIYRGKSGRRILKQSWYLIK
jgi:hypothetical protein